MSAYRVVLSEGGEPVDVPEGPDALARARSRAKALATEHRGSTVLVYRVSERGGLSPGFALRWDETRRQPEAPYGPNPWPASPPAVLPPPDAAALWAAKVAAAARRKR
jgi:hypothetical protein